MKTSILRKEIRIRAATIICKARSSHIAGVFSSADILAVLYGDILRRNNQKFYDIFILSKGHCCAGVYAALNCLGILSYDELQSYGKDDSNLTAHINHNVKGVEFSTGSLGHGLPFGVGKSLVYKREQSSKNDKRVYVLLSDGELDEGSNWEAILFAAHHKLNNLTMIIDYNKYQSLDKVSKTLNLEPLAEKFRAFNWDAIECNGHCINEIKLQLIAPTTDKPRCIICHTVKGYPIDFMIDKVEWHYKPPSEAELKIIIDQIGACCS
jgi:transketolase